jgi:hypothetical protein
VGGQRTTEKNLAFSGAVAQWLEHPSDERKVEGSVPSRPTFQKIGGDMYQKPRNRPDDLIYVISIGLAIIAVCLVAIFS